MTESRPPDDAVSWHVEPPTATPPSTSLPFGMLEDDDVRPGLPPKRIVTADEFHAPPAAPWTADSPPVWTPSTATTDAWGDPTAGGATVVADTWTPAPAPTPESITTDDPWATTTPQTTTDDPWATTTPQTTTDDPWATTTPQTTDDPWASVPPPPPAPDTWVPAPPAAVGTDAAVDDTWAPATADATVDDTWASTPPVATVDDTWIPAARPTAPVATVDDTWASVPPPPPPPAPDTWAAAPTAADSDFWAVVAPEPATGDPAPAAPAAPAAPDVSTWAMVDSWANDGLGAAEAPEPVNTWTLPPEPVPSPVPPAFEIPVEPTGDDPAAADDTSVDDAAPRHGDALAVIHASPSFEAGNDDLLPVLLDVPVLSPHLRDLKAKAQEALIERMGSRLYDRTLTEEQIETYVITELGGFLFEQDARLADHEREQLTQELINDVLRHGPIEPFLEDETVSEIMVNGLNSIYVERSGKLVCTQSNFLTEAHLRQIIERIVSKVGRRIDESSPMVDARLPDGSRVNAVIPPLAVDGPSLTIRKFSRDALTVDDLIAFGTLSPVAVEFLSTSVRGRLNVLVSGGTGTGKTTMLNVLSSFIPEDERIVTLEDAVELQLRQNHLVRLESRPPNVEGKGQVSIRDLVRNSLRMRPDRVIIGECRGGEAMDMLQAMNTGHDGSLSTLHANGPRDALARLETLCLMAGMDLPVKAIREQIASAVDLIVHVARLRDGTRRVTHVSEVEGLDGESLMLSDIFAFDFDAGLGPDGRYRGSLRPTGTVPLVLRKLRDHGENISEDIFAAPLDELVEQS